MTNISIHAAHEGCDEINAQMHFYMSISIHAAHEGCDCLPGLICARLFYFNPRSP